MWGSWLLGDRDTSLEGGRTWVGFFFSSSLKGSGGEKIVINGTKWAGLVGSGAGGGGASMSARSKTGREQVAWRGVGGGRQRRHLHKTGAGTSGTQGASECLKTEKTF